MGIGNLAAELGLDLSSELITPHGDRKLSSPLAEDIGKEVSLPLMGIGNGAAPTTTRCSTASHYPSWGSETCRPLSDLRCHLRPHYPSWGSETCVADAALEGTTGSLPLMGIGNPVVNDTVARLSGLITPHGDRKRGCPGRADRRDYPHYPSWGSETLKPTGLT